MPFVCVNMFADKFAKSSLNVSFSWQDSHSFLKMPFACVNMIADKFAKSSLFAKELHTFSQIDQVSMKINFMNGDKLYQT